MKYSPLNFSRNKADILFYVSHNYEIHTFFRTVRKKNLYFSSIQYIRTYHCHVYIMSFVSFIKIFIYNIFQIEDDLATYVGAGSKVKDMTAVNTVSILITFYE